MGDSRGDSWLSVAGSSSEAALVPKDTAGIASALSALSAAQLQQLVDAITTPTSAVWCGRCEHKGTSRAQLVVSVAEEAAHGP